MPRSKSKLTSYKESRIYCAVISALTGFFVIMGCLFLFSAVISKIDAPPALITVMSTISLCVGAYVGGFTGAKKRRKNGMLMGLLTGAVIFAAIFIISIIFAKTAITFTAASKLLLTVVFGAVGGIVGVNSKIKRY